MSKRFLSTCLLATFALACAVTRPEPLQPGEAFAEVTLTFET